VVTQTNSVQLHQSVVQRPTHYIYSADFKALSSVKFRFFMHRISETIILIDCRKCGAMSLINGQCIILSRARGSVTNNKELWTG
jgi:hypothetical protein